MFPNPEVSEVTLEDYLKILQKRLNLIIAILVIFPLAVTIFVFTAQPLYRATASILIERVSPQTQITKVDDVLSPRMQDYQYYQTQYDILRSRTLAERVFDELRLSKDLEFKDSKDPIGKLQNQINIQPVKNSSLVLINAYDFDALKASAIANALANVYIKQDAETKSRVIRQALGWLEAQVGDVKKKLEDSELTLNKYLQENKIIAGSEIGERETALQKLKTERSKLETELATALKRYREKHPKIIALNGQLSELNKNIEQETENLRLLGDKMIRYNILKKEVESNQQLYANMLERSKQADIIEKAESTSIRVIDPAKPPRAPFKPQKGKSIITSLFFALFFGVGLVFFLEYLDSSIRTADDVTLYLKLPFLGYIPSTGKEVISAAERSLICHQKPQSTITEAYRACRTAIIFASPEDRPLKSILITSAVPGEGKSFFALNIATIFANINERVLLLDIDMRRPTIYKALRFDLKPGLSNFLTGNINLETIIKPSPVKNLSVITSGTIPPNPSELLSSGKIHVLFEELKSKFDRIVIDSPPILSTADTSLLANMVDGVILVLKGGVTRLQAITRARDKIVEAKGRVIGAVINNIAPEKEDRYYYYHYYYSEEGKKKKA
ncbi:MAG: polysaccharide biosynthesis tyrosine autokinase [Candidatus Omnitrophota bacterium]|jgi:capsular exopolysaccharide synthesis family protein